MIFHTFGNDSGKAILLIHGMLNPWQIWKEVSDAFSNEYFVIIPELDAHTQEEASEFISVDDEAVKIRDYLQKNFFDYADMKDTYFVGDGKDPCSGYSPAQEKYISDKEDKYRQAEGAYVYLFSAGSVVSTAEDVLRWLRVVSSSEEMYNATDRKIVEHSTWLYNYGWNTGDYIWHHSGRTYAYSSQIYADYKTDTQLVILTNVSFYEPLGELAYRVYYPLVDEVKKAK